MDLDDIYDAATDAAALEALPARLAELVGAQTATIQTFNARRELIGITHAHLAPDMIAYWVEHEFWRHDVWSAIAFRECGDGRAISTDSYLSTDAFRSSLMYNEYFRHFGDDTSFCMGTNLRTQESIYQVGLHRRAGAGGYDAEEVGRLQRVIPHIRRAMTLRERLARAEREVAAHREILDQMPVALLRLEADGRASFLNAAAESIVRSEDGIVLRHQRLCVDTPSAQAALDEAIRQAAGRTGGRGGGLLVARRRAPTSYRLIVGPAGRDGEGAVLVLIEDPATRPPSLEPLFTSLFGLTSAEASLAAGLAHGKTLDDIARARDVRISTVRTQVRNLLLKTERRRLTDLVIDLSRVAAIAPRV